MRMQLISRRGVPVSIGLIVLMLGAAASSYAVECSLTPSDAINRVGSVHAATATVTDGGSPLSGVTVDFLVIAGPHSGENGSDVTDASGQASFSYTGILSGTDTIQASGTAMATPFSCTAEKVWSASPFLTAAMADSLKVDVDGDNRADPADTLGYTVTITNNSNVALTNVTFEDLLDANTTLVPGSLNASALAFDDSYSAIIDMQLSIDSANGVLVNDVDPDSDPLTVTIYDATSALGGTVNMSGDGSFDYTPPPGVSGVADTFYYAMGDGAGVTDTARVTLNLLDLDIWFVDNTKPNGIGTQSSPFNNLADAEAASVSGDIIFIFEGSGTTGQDAGITLKEDQRLIGQGVDFVVLGTTLVTASNNPVIGNTTGDGIVLADGNTVEGLTIDSAFGNGISGSGITDATLGSVTLQNPGALGVSLSSVSGQFDISSVSITGSGGDGVNLSGGSANFDFSGLSISTASGDGFVANGGTITIASGSISTTDGVALDVSGSTFDATFSSIAANNSGGPGVSLSGNTGTTTIDSLAITNTGGTGLLVSNAGTLNISGAVNSITTTTGAAVDVDNTAVNLTFASLSSTNSGARGIDLGTVSGRFTVTGMTTVDGAAGEAIRIVNVSGAGSSLTFGDVDVLNRNSTGIFMDTVAGTAQFGIATIPNPLSAGGYGIRLEDSSADVTFATATISDANQTIAETLDPTTDLPLNEGNGDAIFLINNTGSFTLNGGTLSSPDGEGVDARYTPNLSLTNVTISNPVGNGIRGVNLSGTSTLTNVTVEGFNTTNKDGLQLYNTTTNLDVTVDGCTFRNSTTGRNGILFQPRSSSNSSLTVQNGTLFEALLGNGVIGSVGSTATMTLLILDSVFQNASGTLGQCGIDIASADSGTAQFRIENNTLNTVMRAAGFSGAINLRASSSQKMIGVVRGNDLDDSNRQGIGLVSDGLNSPSFDVTIEYNTIDDCGREGIDIRLDETASGVARITGNQVGTISPVGNDSSTRDGIELRARDNTDDFYVSLKNNQVVVNSSLGKALDLDAEDNANIYASVTDGNLFQNTGGGRDFDAETEDPGSTLCLKLTGHTSRTFDLTETAGIFQVENLVTINALNPGATINIGAGVENSSGCPIHPVQPPEP